MRRPRSAESSAWLALLVAVALGTACRTAPPPPPPAPVPVTPAPEAAPAPPPEESVRVTGSSLNVRKAPGTSAAVVARVKKGDRLVVLGRDGTWVKVRLPGGGEGWASAKYVKADQPCATDKPGAELLSGVPLSFTEGASAGKVVIEATVDATGKVAATKVVTDTTGIPELVQRAEAEARALLFSPPVRDCRPQPFLYTYTRNF